MLTICKDFFLDKIDDVGNFHFYPNRPKRPDIEILALTLMAEAMGIFSENWLFSMLRADYGSHFAQLPDRSNFSRFRHQSYPH